MNYNFTDRVRKVLAMAREEAIRLQHDYVGTEHILLGLIREGEGVAAAVLTNLSVDLEQVQERIEESVRRGKATIALGELPYTSRAKKVLEFAMAEARELNHSYVGTEHLLLGERAEGGEEVEDAGARPLLPRPHRAGPQRRARPDHRPRRGDRAGDGDPVAPEEEQPRADR
jgi:ATP-dependent Clp protease ATP-binding subunit ClpC